MWPLLAFAAVLRTAAFIIDSKIKADDEKAYAAEMARLTELFSKLFLDSDGRVQPGVERAEADGLVIRITPIRTGLDEALPRYHVEFTYQAGHYARQFTYDSFTRQFVENKRDD